MEIKQLLMALEDIESRYDRLLSAGESISSNGLSLESVSEIQAVTGKDGIVDAYFSASESREKFVMEEFSAGIWALIAAAAAAFLALVIKLINWIRGKKSGDGKTEGIDAKAAGKNIKDAKGIIDGVSDFNSNAKSLNDKAIATEDISLAKGGALDQLYSELMERLNENEVDFLTNGPYFHAVKKAASQFGHGRFTNYLEVIHSEILQWSKHALLDAAKVNSMFSADLDDFMEKEETAVSSIRRRHSLVVDEIEFVAESCRDARPYGKRENLSFFMERPSEVFPFISNIWDRAGFEEALKEDRVLLKSLEKFKKEYEQEIHNTRAATSADIKPNKAEEYVHRLNIALHRETLAVVRHLSFIAKFVQDAAGTGLAATDKCYSFIIRILMLLKKKDTIDKVELDNALNGIREKRKELIEIISNKE